MKLSYRTARAMESGRSGIPSVETPMVGMPSEALAKEGVPLVPRVGLYTTSPAAHMPAHFGLFVAIPHASVEQHLNKE
jgi:hypothetical protein